MICLDFHPDVILFREGIKNVYEKGYLVFFKDLFQDSYEVKEIIVLSKYKLKDRTYERRFPKRMEQIEFMTFLTNENSSFLFKLLKKIKIFWKVNVLRDESLKKILKEIEYPFDNKIIEYSAPYFTLINRENMFITNYDSKFLNFPYFLIDDYLKINIPYFLVGKTKEDAEIRFKIYKEILLNGDVDKLSFEYPDFFLKESEVLSDFMRLKSKDRKWLIKNKRED